MNDKRTRGQLESISETVALLTSANIPIWLFGGWALDFLLGRVTRPHKDIEWVTRATHQVAIQQILPDHGYEPFEKPHPKEEIGFHKTGCGVSFILTYQNEAGEVIPGGRYSDVIWPEHAWSAPPGRIGSIVCPIVSAKTLLWHKEIFPAHPHGPAAPRPRDIEAMAILRRYLKDREGNPQADGAVTQESARSATP